MIRDEASRLASFLKHSKAVRFLAAPVLNARLNSKQRDYATSKDALWIKSQRDAFSGERCFIVGNGPSITSSDLDLISDEISFASNGIVRMFSESRWRPTFYVVVDGEYIQHEAKNFTSLPVEHVLVDLTPFSKPLQGQSNIILLNKRPTRYSVRKYDKASVFFSEKPYECVSEGYTVTYTCLQLALFMGFSEIYLLGMDHTYTHTVDEEGRVSTLVGVADHCYKDAPGTHVNPQFKEGVELAYRMARDEAERRGVHIFNATRGGSLEIFERADLDKILTDLRKCS